MQAGNFMVNDDGDAPDALAGDNVCDVLPPGDPAPAVCTLRAAIMQANANTDASTVWIPPGFHIVLSGALPQIVRQAGISPREFVAISAIARPTVSVSMWPASEISASDPMKKPTTTSTSTNAAVSARAIASGRRCRAPGRTRSGRSGR